MERITAGSSPCASCKLLRRRCAKDCMFAPYFPPDDPQRFVIVHKVFGASNVSKMLQEPGASSASASRCSEQFSIRSECELRVKDPVYGCVGAMSFLQDQVSQLQMQLAMAQAEILSIQMQQNPASALLQNQIQQFADEKPVILNSENFDNVHEYLNNFAAFSGNHVIQDPMKKESLWT